ncbi:MAG: hypothetical protein M1834_005168 [Cirrosporium novae-zelandiae]|nr:MAG: hypothetical protein M1834_005168 [Cirrosporium novae-zelandiae]
MIYKWVQLLATICLVWYIFIAIVVIIGYTQLRRWYSKTPPPPISPSLPSYEIPHITVIRPVKGLEPRLYECLAATYHQTYPRNKLTICFCVASYDDPAFPILKRLAERHPAFETKIYVEEEDHEFAHDGQGANKLGPNPKIRNMSRAYHEAKSDIIWIFDCNAWVGKGVAGRMVDKLCGFTHEGLGYKYKFVHLLPMVIDVDGEELSAEMRGLLHQKDGPEIHVASSSTASHVFQIHDINQSRFSSILGMGGGRLEELFFSSSHAKFYTAINTVLVAPCIVGKSTMFRRSHLDELTAGDAVRPPGIDTFSDNICEDHLIGDTLWKHKLAAEKDGEVYGKHALVFGNIAMQPMASMSVKEYIARRARWLRVRKFTVMAATLVEPGTESFLCSLYGAFAATTLPWIHECIGIPQTWTAFSSFWIVSVTLWACLDWTLYILLHSARTVEVDQYTPSFARPLGSYSRRPFKQWLAAWLGREILAFPIWAWAVFGGMSLEWRGKKFWVGIDMKVHEYDEDPCPIDESVNEPLLRPRSGKPRSD